MAYKKQFVAVTYQNKYNKVLDFMADQEYRSRTQQVQTLIEDALTNPSVSLKKLLNVKVKSINPYRIINSNRTKKNGGMNAATSKDRTKFQTIFEVNPIIKMELRKLAATYHCSEAYITACIITNACKHVKVPAKYVSSFSQKRVAIGITISGNLEKKLRNEAKIANRSFSAHVAKKIQDWLSNPKKSFTSTFSRGKNNKVIAAVSKTIVDEIKQLSSSKKMSPANVLRSALA